MNINSQLAYQNGIFPAPTPTSFATAEDIRARSHDLIAPNVHGVVLLKWLAEPGKTGVIRAQEILDEFSQNPMSGVIWGITNYLKNNPTGNSQVDSLFQSEVFDALGIDITVGSLKSFLKHIVIHSGKIENN